MTSPVRWKASETRQHSSSLLAVRIAVVLWAGGIKHGAIYVNAKSDTWLAGRFDEDDGGFVIEQLEVDLDAVAVKEGFLVGDERVGLALSETLGLECGQVLLRGGERVGLIGKTHDDREERIVLADRAIVAVVDIAGRNSDGSIDRKALGVDRDRRGCGIAATCRHSESAEY